MARNVNRIPSRMPVKHMQTFQVTMPVSTHRRPATCTEVECPQQARGWKMKIDLRTDLGQAQGQYIKHQSGRSYVATKLEDGTFELVFEPGQTCFAQHTVSLEREANYLVRKGDHRTPGSKARRHVSAEDWVDEFAANQAKLKEIIEKG